MFKNTKAVVDGMAFLTPYLRMGVATIVWVPEETRRHYTVGGFYGGGRISWNYEIQQVGPTIPYHTHTHTHTQRLHTRALSLSLSPYLPPS